MRYRHERTGVVVDVDEQTASHLEPAYKPVEGDAPAPRSSSRRRPAAKPASSGQE